METALPVFLYARETNIVPSNEMANISTQQLSPVHSMENDHILGYEQALLKRPIEDSFDFLVGFF